MFFRLKRRERLYRSLSLSNSSHGPKYSRHSLSPASFPQKETLDARRSLRSNLSDEYELKSRRGAKSQTLSDKLTNTNKDVAGCFNFSTPREAFK